MKHYVIIYFMFLFLNGCVNGQDNMQDNIYASNIELYKNSPAWELAQAVEKEDTDKIKSLSKANPDLLNYQEKKFGQTLLEWAVYTDRYEATKALIEAGGDPNVQSYDGTSAFIHAADKNTTSKYVKLLLKHGGDVNAIAKRQIDTVEKVQQLKTPLIAAAGSNFETVKILVEAGANINYIDKNYQSALHTACNLKKINIIRYLVIDKEADVSKPLYVTLSDDTLYLHHLLRELRFKLDSEEHKTKMEVAEFLKKEYGMDYWETPIPKRLYNVHTKEYLEKY